MDGYIIVEDKKSKERTVVLEDKDDIYYIGGDGSSDISDLTNQYKILARLNLAALTIKKNPYVE